MTSPFYQGTPFQFAWNSSSLGTLKDCPRKYYYKYIENWTGRGESLHLRFGSLYHKGLELYDQYTFAGSEPEDALDQVVDYLLTETWDGREPEGSGGAPWDTSEHPAGNKKNRWTLIRSVVWYIDHFAEDPVTTVLLPDGKPAVELTFKFEMEFYTPKDEPYLFTGHMDRLVTYGDEMLVMDRKTTGGALGHYFFDKFNPDNQMSLYTFASQIIYSVPVSGVLIDAAQIAVGFTNFGRALTMRSRGQLSEWMTDTEHWLRTAERFAEAQYWPMNDNSCHKYDGCEFRHICRQDPQVRSHFLETAFVRDPHSAERILEA